jgi:hypothetical protein
MLDREHLSDGPAGGVADEVRASMPSASISLMTSPAICSTEYVMREWVLWPAPR